MAARNSSIVAIGLMMASAIGAPSVFAQTTVDHADVLRARLGMGRIPSDSSLSALKVAVFDTGFSGFTAESARLPRTAQLVDGPVNPFDSSTHGLAMAEIIWGVLGRSPLGPQFYLVNTNGLSNFKAAIDYVIANQIDVVVNAQTWNYGSNLDGTGFIDALVSRAIDAGVVWVNAAGNDHDMVYASTVAGMRDTLNVTVDYDDTEVSVYLLWTDVSDDDAVSATTDLDVALEDSSGTELAAGRHRQNGPAGDANTSRFAREVAIATVNRGNYRIRLENFSHNFRVGDELRVVVASNKPGTVHLTEASGRREILPLADHPRAIIVGDGTVTGGHTHSSVGPTRDGRNAPDVTIADSTVAFTDGFVSSGSSNATALFAARYIAELARLATPRGEGRLNLARRLSRGVSAPLPFVCLTEVPLWHLDTTYSVGLPQGTRAGHDAYGHQYAVLAPGRSRESVRGPALSSPFFQIITAEEESGLCGH